MNDRSGIYFLLREDENGFKYAYIGQAVHTLSRLASHLVGYEQHIDLSLRKHKLYSENNPYGWRVEFLNFPESQLDEKEKYYIKLYANKGYQLRNVSIGGQHLKDIYRAYNKAERTLQGNYPILQKNTLKSKLERIKSIIRCRRNSMRNLWIY